jgi:hypothetical protein
MAVENTQDYYVAATITAIEIFMVQTLGWQSYITFYGRNLSIL